ncbi:MAG: efflux RND transporter periplasmic adaptor subunit [Myxococcota bacterium]|nr:efflux RND transporter periplasmic adaptor subunit [Myxococcota bacterium]
MASTHNLILSGILMCLCCWGCDRTASSAESGHELVARDQAKQSRVSVETAAVVPVSDSGAPLKVSGTVTPFRRAPMAFLVGGPVDAVRVNVGDVVAKGDVLARLVRRDFRIAIEEASAGVLAAKAQLNAAKNAGVGLADRELNRAKQLAGAGAASQALIDRAETQKQQADATLQQAEAGLARAKALRKKAAAAMQDAVLKAPFSGIVVARTAEKGQIVGPGIPIVVLEQLDRVRVVGSVAAGDLNRIDRSEPVKVTVLEREGASYTGTIRALGWAGDVATGTFPLEIVVENPDYLLRSGMTAFIVLNTAKHRDQKGGLYKVPLPAVVSRGDGAHVFTVTGSPPETRARRLPVTLAGFEDNWALISGALDSNIKVVVRGQHDLNDGMVVAEVASGGKGE